MSFVISLLSTHTTYVISVLTVSERRGFKLDARQQRELGGHPGFLQLRTRAGTSREISTATSRALRLHSHVRARASASGKECGKKKKPKSLGRLSRPESAAAELGGGRPSAESRAPGGGSRAAARDPLKAGGDRPAAPRPHQGRKPRRRPHESRPWPHAAPPRSLLVRADPVPVTDSEILGRHLGRQQHSRPQRRPPPEPRGLAPGLPARRRTRPPLLGVGGRRSDDEGHPGREPAAAVKKRRPRPRRSARGSAPRRPHRVPEQALRRQPGLVAIAASRAPRSVP